MPDSRIAVSCALLVAASLSFAQQMPSPVVQISTVSRTEVAPTVAVPGTVYSRNEVQITAGVAGQLVLVAEPGTIVSKGDYIARIDKRSLRLQRAEQEALLERAEINVRQLESQLRRQKELASSSLVSEFELEQTQANRDLAMSDRGANSADRRSSATRGRQGPVCRRRHQPQPPFGRGGREG
jgi:multidrug efflux pump subunit AcrA (membrane-fusion protein)